MNAFKLDLKLPIGRFYHGTYRDKMMSKNNRSLEENIDLEIFQMFRVQLFDLLIQQVHLCKNEITDTVYRGRIHYCTFDYGTHAVDLTGTLAQTGTY